MRISSSPRATWSRSNSTSVTSIRGSQRSSASRISVSICATVPASIVSNTKWWTPQPNSGRIGRSPGAVARISWIAWSTSVASLARAMPPLRSTWRGNAMPEPSISAMLSRPYPRLMIAPLTFTGPEDWMSTTLPLSFSAPLVSTVTEPVPLIVTELLAVSSGVEQVVAGAALAVAVDLDGHLLAGAQRHRLQALDVDLVVRLDAERRLRRVVLGVLEVRRQLRLAVIERADDDRPAGVAVLERDDDLV